jgi:2-dehydropantoate 2-reductase
MKTLIVGIGALGGLIAARLRAAGCPVWLATRNAEQADRLRASGLRVSGAGAVTVQATAIAPLEAYAAEDEFDLVLLATKARDAIEAAPKLSCLLRPNATLLPIQNGGVPQMLAERLGNCVLGGLSNLGATMETLGVYEQRNAGHLLIGELAGGDSERTKRVRGWLERAVEVRATGNMRGAVWSKLLVNCSVTTIGAIAGGTMREYMASPEGRELFNRTYDEALSVALATGAQPEEMLVEPVPPGWRGDSVASGGRDAWIARILTAYGDVTSSMLQDLRRGRTTEIEFINGYVVNMARQIGLDAPINAAIVETVHAISDGRLAPNPKRLAQVLQARPQNEQHHSKPAHS